jgi:predicted DNA-binding transcriptional regulator AlpA
MEIANDTQGNSIMPISNLLSYADLVRIGVVNNRTQLSRLKKGQEFPEGFLISENARRWQEDEVAEWIEVRRGTGSYDKIGRATND